MTDLTDDQINRRLAEIAWIKVEEDAGALWHESDGPWAGEEWNPLRDWNQLMPLAVERFIHLSFLDTGECEASCGGTQPTYNVNPCPRRAIALAIIASEGE